MELASVTTTNECDNTLLTSPLLLSSSTMGEPQEMILRNYPRSMKSLSHRLKCTSLIFSVVFGYCIQMTTVFVKSSTCDSLLPAASVVATLVQSSHIFIHLPSGAATATTCCSNTMFRLWLAASVLCLLGGFYLAWGVMDLLRGLPLWKLVIDLLWESLAMTLCVLCLRAIGFGSNQAPPDYRSLPLVVTTTTTSSESSPQDPEAVNMNSKKETRNSKIVQYFLSLMVTFAVGYSIHMTMVLVTLTRPLSFYGSCEILLGAMGIVVLIVQSRITSWQFGCCEKQRHSSGHVVLGLVISAGCHLSGLFCGFMVTNNSRTGFQEETTFSSNTILRTGM